MTCLGCDFTFYICYVAVTFLTYRARRAGVALLYLQAVVSASDCILWRRERSEPGRHVPTLCLSSPAAPNLTHQDVAPLRAKGWFTQTCPWMVHTCTGPLRPALTDGPPPDSFTTALDGGSHTTTPLSLILVFLDGQQMGWIGAGTSGRSTAYVYVNNIWN